MRDPARILVLTSTYPRWRDDTIPPFVHELARRLTKHHEIHVLAPHTRSAMPYEEMDGVEVHRFRYLPARFETLAYGGGMLPGLRRRPWRLLLLPIFLTAELVATVRLLRRQRYAAIHAHWLLPHGLIAVWARALCGYRPALICTAHGSDVYALRGRLAWMLKRYVIRHCSTVAVVSGAMRDSLNLHMSAPNIAVLPMGTDTLSRFTPGPSPRQTQLLFVGRLTPQKGLQVLLRALAAMPAPAPQLVVVGDGPERSALQRQALALGLKDTVEFIGPVANQHLSEYYRRSAIVVFPSVLSKKWAQEGLGLVPIEALACGCAVVASDQPGIRDVIAHGETGLLVEPGDAAALAKTLTKLIQDRGLRERLAAQGRAHVQARFDWNIIADRYAELFCRSGPQRISAGGDAS